MMRCHGRDGREGREGREGRDGRDGRAGRAGRDGRDVFSGPRGTWIGMVNECHVAARHPPGGCGIRNWTPLTLFSFVYSNTWSTCDVFETKTSISMDAFASSRPSQPTMALRLVVSSCSLRSGPNWPRMPYLRQCGRQSDAIRDNQMQSTAIRGNQRQSEANRGIQRQSEAIGGNRRQSDRNQRQSEAIRHH